MFWKSCHVPVIAACLSLGMFSAASAHSVDSGKLTIEHPWAQPAKAGSSTRLYMTIANEEFGAVTFLGLRTPVAAGAKIAFWAAPRRIATLDSIVIASGETLDFGSSRMWVALNGLKKDLVNGQTFQATARFTDGREVNVTVVVGRDTGLIEDDEHDSRDSAPAVF